MAVAVCFWLWLYTAIFFGSAFRIGSGGAVCCPLPSFLAADRAGWLPAVAAVAQGGRCAALVADHVGGWLPGPVPVCAAVAAHRDRLPVFRLTASAAGCG